MELQKIAKLVQKFICGLDENDFEIDKVSWALNFANDLSISSLFIYDSRVSSLEEGISRKIGNGSAAVLLEIYWVDDNYELWSQSTSSYHLTQERLELIKEIMSCLDEYNNEVLP